MAKRPASEADKLIIRLPDGMREKIRRAAASNNRSMNGEVIARLEQSFETSKRKPNGAPQTTMADILKQIEELEQRIDELSIPDFVTAGRLDDVEARLMLLEARGQK